jgi:cytochrome c oxidase subunit 3
VTEAVHESHESHGKLGMWLFLLTEILLFGGLFLLYMGYRIRYPGEFHEAAAELSRLWGTLNTAVLLTSSLLVALSIHAFERDRRSASRIALIGAVVLGTGFLGVKAIEWTEKFQHGLYPSSPELLALGPGHTMYFGLYYSMTGLHALHVIVGVTVLAVLLVRMGNGTLPRQRLALLDNGGLYWHLVDLVWIFLFPLFYLVG